MKGQTFVYATADRTQSTVAFAILVIISLSSLQGCKERRDQSSVKYAEPSAAAQDPDSLSPPLGSRDGPYTSIPSRDPEDGLPNLWRERPWPLYRANLGQLAQEVQTDLATNHDLLFANHSEGTYRQLVPVADQMTWQKTAEESFRAFSDTGICEVQSVALLTYALPGHKTVDVPMDCISQSPLILSVRSADELTSTLCDEAGGALIASDPSICGCLTPDRNDPARHRQIDPSQESCNGKPIKTEIAEFNRRCSARKTHFRNVFCLVAVEGVRYRQFGD